MTTVSDFVNRVARKLPAWPLYIVGAAYAAWLVWLGATGGLGVEPIKALERELGSVALKLLVVGLAITPLRTHARINLIKFRRAIGLLSFFFVALHLLVWLVLDVQLLGQIWADIVKRPYVTIGMTAFVLMIPLAATSNNWSVRKLGPKWRQLHKLTYGVVLLGAIHFLWLVKGFQLEPLIYLAVILALLVLRIRPARRKAAA